MCFCVLKSKGEFKLLPSTSVVALIVSGVLSTPDLHCRESEEKCETCRLLALPARCLRLAAPIISRNLEEERANLEPC